MASLQASCRRRAPGKPRGCVGPAQPRGARRGPPVVHGFSFGSPTFGSSPFGSPTLGSPPFGSPAFGSPSFGSPAFHGCEIPDPAPIFCRTAYILPKYSAKRPFRAEMHLGKGAGGGKPTELHQSALFWVYGWGHFLSRAMCFPRPLPQASCFQFEISPPMGCSVSPMNHEPPFSALNLLWTDCPRSQARLKTVLG